MEKVENPSQRLITNPLVMEDTFPLRIWGDDGESKLACSYELSPNDNVTFHRLDESSYTIRVEAIPVEGSRYVRTFLISKLRDRFVVTMSGGSGDNSVAVYSWKARKGKTADSETEREGMAMLENVELVHLQGLEKAVEGHKGRIERLDLVPLSLEEGRAFYRAMQEYCPRY